MSLLILLRFRLRRRMKSGLHGLSIVVTVMSAAIALLM